MRVLSEHPWSSIRLCGLILITLVCVACSGDGDPVDPADPEIPEDQPADGPAVTTANNIVTAFRSFLEDNTIDAGSIAVHYAGQLIADSGINRLASDPAPVASLSKAITAVCTFNALKLTGVSPDTPIEQILPELLSSTAIGDERIKQITVAQLISHNSGIHTPHISVLGPFVETMQAEQILWQFEFIAHDGLAADPGSGYFYANANYLILGLVIEKLTGEAHESWCNQNVLQPLSISSAKLSSLWTILSSYGGWEISAIDYAKFVDAYFTSYSVLDENPDTFATKILVNNDTYYGPGTFMRSSPTGYLYWHNGSFTWVSPQQSGNFGAFFASYANDFTVSVNLNEDLTDGRGSELDWILYQAAHDL
jgi:CubicO group peptidase (beta-lactamase class C family)